MCGIVGYVGARPCVDLIVSGLKKLEYRGYDSAGVAVVGAGGLAVARSKGKLRNLVALLAEKLSATPEASGAAASHLGALRDQVVRVNEILRRLVDVADPSAPLGYTDVGALLADLASLLGHDARRRRIALAVDAHAGAVRTRADAARVGRVLLGALARAVATTPEGGRLAVRAAVEGEWAVVRLEQAPGDPAPETGYYSEVAAAAVEGLGGRLEVSREDGQQRTELRLPRNDRS